MSLLVLFGLLDAAEPAEPFAYICQYSNPSDSPWFTPAAHGTCAERQAAFQAGYVGARGRLMDLCGGVPFDVLIAVCGLPQ